VEQLIRLAMAGALVCALATAACGEGGADRRDAGRGGTLTMLSSSDVDFLDPGRTYFAQGIQVASATQRTLYGFRPTDLEHPVADLAAGGPAISDGGRTVTIRIRRGVRFSPPVGREVRSRDVAYAFERFFSVSVAGPYQQYFGDLIGVPATLPATPGRISGISTPDDRTIVFRLRRPTAAAFVKALVLPITAPVPEEYARRFDRQSPSTYNTHVVATGPYMVRNDTSGTTVGYKAGRSIDLVRNPNWRASTDRRPARLDAVRIVTNARERNVASRQVLAGSRMVLDSTPPPTIIKRVVEGARDQGVIVPAGGYRFMPLNTSIKPFDRLDVRRAVLAAYDREASRKARGGAVTGPVATHFLPPGIPGHEEAGAAAGTGVDFLASPEGDPALAKAYMKRAGFPSGRYTGGETFLLVAGSSDGERGMGAVAAATLRSLGFKVRLKIVPDDALFTSWCSVPSREVLACPGIAWLKDYPDPEPMLKPVFGGAAFTQRAGNTNFSQLRDPAIDAAMARARLLSGEARLRAWGQIDDMIVRQAAAVPLQWEQAMLIHSKDVNGVANVYFDSWDLSYTSLK
jgi:peptide/nickel transport system substrate-binding protein